MKCVSNWNCNGFCVFTKRKKTQNAIKHFDYTTIADRIRTISWSNDSHQTGVVKPVYESQPFH